MSRQSTPSPIATIGIDIGKNTFHLVGLDQRGAIVLQLKSSREQFERRLANLPRRLIGMEVCSGAHHIGRQLAALGHDVRLIPAHYVKPLPEGAQITLSLWSARRRTPICDSREKSASSRANGARRKLSRRYALATLSAAPLLIGGARRKAVRHAEDGFGFAGWWGVRGLRVRCRDAPC
jgi:hypothetical protein